MGEEKVEKLDVSEMPLAAIFEHSSKYKKCMYF
jgi:hypothetical protein